MKTIVDYIREAGESRAQALEAAVIRFMECGVELQRFSLHEYHSPRIETHLCIDGVPRFKWRLNIGYQQHGRET